ncbi:DNA-binding response regulator [Babesia caballi]|uniref:DNA-binding response regulator n=1 Tax=Babesia caballi TaxID=5871 RepID=A0AAV4LUL3_BABCB|nr:DNA-binding response regulator [Babesia caballi]
MRTHSPFIMYLRFTIVGFLQRISCCKRAPTWQPGRPARLAETRGRLCAVLSCTPLQQLLDLVQAAGDGRVDVLAHFERLRELVPDAVLVHVLLAGHLDLEDVLGEPRLLEHVHEVLAVRVDVAVFKQPQELLGRHPAHDLVGHEARGGGPEVPRVVCDLDGQNVRVPRVQPRVAARARPAPLVPVHLPEALGARRPGEGGLPDDLDHGAGGEGDPRVAQRLELERLVGSLVDQANRLDVLDVSVPGGPPAVEAHLTPGLRPRQRPHCLHLPCPTTA